MNKLIQFIKNIKLRQILTIFLMSSLLVVSTACGSGNIAQAGGQTYTDMGKRAMSDTYDEYDANQSFEGGMNGYNDDRRYDGETSAKAKELVDTARSRQADNVGEYVDNLTNRAQNNLQEATNTARQAAQDATQATKDTARDLKNNLEDLS